MPKTQRIVFLCGSPQQDNSSSLLAARYLAAFLGEEPAFIDVAGACLSFDPAEAEAAFLDIARRMEAAEAVVWVFGVVCWHPPVQLKLLFDKLFQQGFSFAGKVAASVMTSGHFLDDYILEHMRLVSEQLGFGYLGDVSAEGIAGGYVDYEETESACRFLARQLRRALDEAYVPYRETAPRRPEELKPLAFAPGFDVPGARTSHPGNKRIAVVSGHKLANNPSARSIVAAIRAFSVNEVAVIELEGAGVSPCKLLQRCILDREAVCAQRDAFHVIVRQLHEADGVVYIGQCASAFIDAHLLTLIGRQGSMLIMPQLTGKYGFAMATGGGALGKDAALYLDKVLNRLGIRSLAALTDGDGRDGDLVATIRWTVEQLDGALEEQWLVAERFTARSEHFFMRDIAARFGFIVQGMYRFYTGNRLFDFPSLWATRVLAFCLRGRRLRDFLVTKAAKATRAQWEKRLARDQVRYGVGPGA